MAYVRKEWDLGEVRQIEKYYPGNYGAPGKKRRKKRERTPEDIERQNRTNRGKKVQRLILANFKPGDWHLILSYTKEKRPKSDEEAKKQIRKFLEQLRKEYRAAGHELKDIYVTEKGKKGAWHHHLIIEDIVDPPVVTAKVVQKLWKHGHPTFNPLYEEGEYQMLADYIVKKETKRKDPAAHIPDHETWSSRNRKETLSTEKRGQKNRYRQKAGTWRRTRLRTASTLSRVIRISTIQSSRSAGTRRKKEEEME